MPHDPSAPGYVNYIESIGTFNSYRRDVKRLLHWSWLIENKNIKELKRDNIESFIRFCQQPFNSWIGTKKAPRFIDINGERIPNSEWRPFVVTVSKAAHRVGERPKLSNFDISHSSIKELFAILSTIYNYLIQEEYVYMMILPPFYTSRGKPRRHNAIINASQTNWPDMVDCIDQPTTAREYKSMTTATLYYYRDDTSRKHHSSYAFLMR